MRLPSTGNRFQSTASIKQSVGDCVSGTGRSRLPAAVLGPCSSPGRPVHGVAGELRHRSVRLLSAYPRPVWASLFRQVSFSRPARRRSGIGFQLAHCFGQGILRLARHGSSVLGVYRVIRSQTQARSLRISAAALPSGSCSTTPSPIGRGSPRRGLRRRPCGDTLLVELRALLHIHPHPQNSKRLHLRFHLGRADHPQRVK